MTEYVRIRFLELLGAIPDNHPLFGSLKDNHLTLPRICSDKRKLSWTKLITKLSSSIVNQPNNDDCCWFLLANKPDGTHALKLCKNGSKNKWQTHRVLKVLQEPQESYKLVNCRTKLYHLMHRCHLGSSTKGRNGKTCVNPFHLRWGSALENQDQKGCIYGAHFLCPHHPSCLFNSHDTGHPKPCFNQPYLSSHHYCTHTPVCSHTLRHLRY